MGAKGRGGHPRSGDRRDRPRGDLGLLVASPPCLTGNQVTSPAAQTLSRPGTRMRVSAGRKPRRGAAEAPGSMTLHGRQGDGVVRADREPVGQYHGPALVGDHRSRRHDPDARGPEELGHRLAGGRTEDLERLGLVGDNRDPYIRHRAAAEVRGREQRELVGGQRPLDLGRHQERNLLSGAVSEPVEERSDELPFVRVTERERPPAPRALAGPRSQPAARRSPPRHRQRWSTPVSRHRPRRARPPAGSRRSRRRRPPTEAAEPLRYRRARQNEGIHPNSIEPTEATLNAR